ncbi:vomeronasal type-2 receptor 116-like [Tenrec ecaudatus]|uniref:vomeronasal type-2 receptor 116-like n=1 Tax=Tenrec ecaudatus TaxID=94439 RepID=UPI003F5930DA
MAFIKQQIEAIQAKPIQPFVEHICGFPMLISFPNDVSPLLPPVLTKGSTGEHYSLNENRNGVPGFEILNYQEYPVFLDLHMKVESPSPKVFVVKLPAQEPTMSFYDCFEYIQPSVYRDGDLVLGGFFPLYMLTQNSGEQWRFFVTSPRQNLTFHQLDFQNYGYILIFLFAIEEINRSPLVLPNISLGFRLYNAFPSVRTLESVLGWLSEREPPIPNYKCQTHTKNMAVIAGIPSEFRVEAGALLDLYRMPQVHFSLLIQISYGTFDPLLKTKDQFSSLYQISLNHSCLVLGLVSLLIHFGWTWVGILVPDDAKGEQFIWELRKEMTIKGVCVALIEKIPVTKIVYSPRDVTYLPRVLDSSANAFITNGDISTLLPMHFIDEYNLITHKIWIITSQWNFSLLPSSDFLDIFHGTLFFSHQKAEIPGFQHFLRTVHPSKYPEDFLLTKYWLYAFNCSLSGTVCGEIYECPPNASLESVTKEKIDVTTMTSINDLYNAVHLVARALHDMIFMGKETRKQLEAEHPVLLPWQLHPFLKNAQLENRAGEHVSLNENRNCVSRYEIVNFLNFPAGLRLPMKVGEFIPQGLRGPGLMIQEELIEWAFGFTETPHSMCSNSCVPGFMKITQKGKPICCFDCIACPEGEMSNQTDSDTCMECSQSEYPNMERNRCLPKMAIFLAYDDPLGMSLACTALGFSVITAVVLWVFVKHRDSAIVKANNRTLSYVLLLSLLLCFLCSLLFIGRPNTATCILRQITFGVVFTVAVSAVLAKTITVILAFKALTPGRTMRRLLLSGASNAVVPICSLIQLIICGVWLGTSPPFVDRDTHSEPRHIIIVCNKGSVPAFYCVLGVLGFLAMGTFFLAYQARNLPDTFNEAKFLTFSMLVFCSVWVTFLPVYHSTQGKVMVTVEIFSILASSVGLLGCIFAPKCYAIFLHPDRNTSKGLRNKTCYEEK